MSNYYTLCNINCPLTPTPEDKPEHAQIKPEQLLTLFDKVFFFF